MDEAASARRHRPAGLGQVVEIEAALGEPLVDALLVAGRQFAISASNSGSISQRCRIADLNLPQHGEALAAETVVLRKGQPLPAAAAEVIDLDPYIPRHMQSAAEHRRL